MAKRNQYITDKIVVKVIKLDQFLPDKRIKLIKIDCEGTEYDVLKGSVKLLTSQKPIVCWEASALINIDNLKKCFNLFFRLGYSHFKFTEDEKFIKLTNLENNLLSLNLNIISIFEGVEI